MRIFRLLILASLLALIASPLNLAYTATSNTFTATSILDTVDANPGDGICADADGNCTLRAAVMEANLNAGPDTIILLQDTYALTISGCAENDAATGDLDLKGTLTITGAGPNNTIIDAELTNDRVIQILSDANVTISGVTMRKGGSCSGPAGGVKNDGILSIANSIISDNYGNYYVGGILNDGEISLFNSTVNGNSARSIGGISNFGIFTITNSTIRDNKSTYSYSNGGGISNEVSGNLTLTNSVVSENSSQGDGGGIINNGQILSLNSIISGNHAETNGGGIENSGVIKLVNSTISGNQSNGSGGGIYNGESGTLEARNATIVNNTANADADSISNNGGGIKNLGSTVDLFNTILASNIVFEDRGNGEIVFVNDDCKGSLNLLSFSLLTTTTGCSITNDDSSITGKIPNLEALADNGGSTQTHALKADSPAIDAGDPNGCKDHEGSDLTTDQRGELRPFDGDQDGDAVCDIGAYEYLLYQGLTVDKTGTGDGSITSTPEGIDCGTECSADLPQGSLITLTAEPAEGSSFIGWSGACAGTDDCQLTMDVGKVVTATFELDQQLTVTKAGTGGGLVTSSPAGIDCGADCSADFALGSLVTLTAEPEGGSSFTGWGGACAGTDDCQLTMDTAKTVTATFTAITDPILKLFLPLTLR